VNVAVTHHAVTGVLTFATGPPADNPGERRHGHHHQRADKKSQ
jgi:hypothetical protein